MVSFTGTSLGDDWETSFWFEHSTVYVPSTRGEEGILEISFHALGYIRMIYVHNYFDLFEYAPYVCSELSFTAFNGFIIR